MKMSDKKTLNPPNIAVALQYDGENSPKVTAKGKGSIADSIIELANQHNIPLHTDTDLVTILSSIPLDDEIPHTLYVAIAEVIAFAYLLGGKTPDNWRGSEDPSETKSSEISSTKSNISV